MVPGYFSCFRLRAGAGVHKVLGERGLPVEHDVRSWSRRHADFYFFTFSRMRRISPRRTKLDQLLLRRSISWRFSYTSAANVHGHSDCFRLLTFSQMLQGSQIIDGYRLSTGADNAALIPVRQQPAYRE
jgi:hypothetical protein